MAEMRNGKRRASPSPEADPPAKRYKRPRAPRTHFPPAFWDNLFKISLTPLALREIDRRNGLQRDSLTSTPTRGVLPKDIARFARQGGPDLCHLRGLAESREANSMASASASTSSRGRQAGGARRTGKSSAYGKDFENHLAIHGVHMDDDESLPKNLEEIQTELSRERASLSPSSSLEAAFKSFRQESKKVVFESEVMATLLPQICGESDIHSKQNVLFTEFKAITDDTAVKPMPDLFDGARSQDLSPVLKKDHDFRSAVIPTKHLHVPVAPNMFVEAKGPDGSSNVLLRQVCYDGAYGARAMHTLQNYGNDEPIYDENAYTYSASYHADGQLKIYSHHVTGPSSAGGRPEYHMTYIRSWGMTGDVATFRDGATALRNARDLARRHRDSFIQAANARAAASRT